MEKKFRELSYSAWCEHIASEVKKKKKENKQDKKEETIDKKSEHQERYKIICLGVARRYRNNFSFRTIFC